MANFTGNAIMAKVKAMYGQRLKENDYLELVKKKSISEIVQYLKGHPTYRGVLENISEHLIRRSQLEHLIRESNFNIILRLINFSYLKDASFYKLYLVKMESEIILEKIRNIISPEDNTVVSTISDYFLKHASFDIKTFSDAKNMEELVDSLIKTPYYKVLKPHASIDNSNIRYVEIENDLDIFYYKTAFKRIEENYKGKLKDDLNNIYFTRIELANIIKIYRMKKFYRASPEDIKDNLIHEYSRITKSQMDELIDLDDPNSILRYLEKSSLSKYTDNAEYVYVEYFADRIRYNLSKRYMYYASAVPKIYTSFLFLREIEIENLTNIIEGVRYNLPSSEILPMLIY